MLASDVVHDGAFRCLFRTKDDVRAPDQYQAATTARA
jgi:hypothetical protein